MGAEMCSELQAGWSAASRLRVQGLWVRPRVHRKTSSGGSSSLNTRSDVNQTS